MRGSGSAGQRRGKATAEHARLSEDGGTGGEWRRYGPWLAERAWGTVREDYSASGGAWTSLTHDEARSTAYRWNEDGGRVTTSRGVWSSAEAPR